MFDWVCSASGNRPLAAVSVPRVLEAMADSGLVKPFHRLALPERYFFENGGRAKLLEIANLSPKNIASKIGSILATA